MKPSKNAYANLGSRLVRDWFDDDYYPACDKPARSWDEVLKKSKPLNVWIPEAERAYLAGALPVKVRSGLHNMKEGSEIGDCLYECRFCPPRNTQTLFKQYFVSWYHRLITSWLLPSTVWSGGTPLRAKVSRWIFHTSNLLPCPTTKILVSLDVPLIIVDEGRVSTLRRRLCSTNYSSNSLLHCRNFRFGRAYMRYAISKLVW